MTNRFLSQHATGGLNPAPPPPQTQLLLSPDGQYSYVMVNPPVTATNHHHHDLSSLQHSQRTQVQHVLHPNHLPHYVTTTVPVHNHPGAGPPPPHPSDPRPISQYWTTTAGPPPHPPIHQHPSHYQTTHLVLPPGTALPSTPYLDARLVPNPNVHMYGNLPYGTLIDGSASGGGIGTSSGGGFNSNSRSSSGKKGSSSGHKNRQSGGGDNSDDLDLHITNVANGSDTRSSLMVRNIPNKYTQQMLLAEFTEFGHGSDKIDFFYLPIDFKNRCNRGYAFINFVDYQDIIPFHEQYNNKQWRVFNSDKVCTISYARIQGKAAMLKRFEHSALLDKNDEYRPLVFTSHGINKGKRENFSSLPLSENSATITTANDES